MMNRSVMQVLYGHRPLFYFARLDSVMRPECDDNTQDTFAFFFFYFELPSKICYAFFIVRRTLVTGAS